MRGCFGDCASNRDDRRRRGPGGDDRRGNGCHNESEATPVSKTKATAGNTLRAQVVTRLENTLCTLLVRLSSRGTNQRIAQGLSDKTYTHTYGQPASQPEAGFRGKFSRFLRTVLKIFELKRGGKQRKQRKTAGKGPKWTLLIKFHVLRDLDQ